MPTLNKVTTVTTDTYGGPFYTTHYFNSSVGDGGASTVQAFWNAMKTFIAGSAVMNFDGTVQQIDSETGQLTGVIPTPPWQVLGSAGGEVAPWFTQGLIQWRTAQFVNGRRLIGRTFIPGVTEQYSSSGVPTAAYTTGLAAGITVMEGGGFVIYSPTHRTFGIVPEGASTAWNKFASLRSRRD